MRYVVAVGLGGRHHFPENPFDSSASSFLLPVIDSMAPLIAELMRHGAVPHSVEASCAPGLVIRHITDRNEDQNRSISPFHAEVNLHSEDVSIKRKKCGRPQVGGGTRGKIEGLSKSSRRNLLFTARNVEGLQTMITLTYPSEYPNDGRKVKRDGAVMRKWLVRRGLKGLWFLEFQEHGAPHYHVFVNGRVDKSEVAQEWYQIVGSGDENHLRAGTRVEAIRGPHAVPTYAAKYAAKFQQKQVPEGYTDVGRFWGTFGGLKVRSETVLSGSFADIAPAARLARRASGAKRRKFAKRKIRDNGRFSLVAYGAAEALRCGLPNVAVAWFLRRDWVIEPKAI